MADWREFGATNESDTCLWCGRKLRFKQRLDPTVPFNTLKAAAGEKHPTIISAKSGDYEDGFFCGLRCAYGFAEQMATFGHRLAPRKVAPR